MKIPMSMNTWSCVAGRWIFRAALLMVLSAAAWGQIDRGTIQGVVNDQSGLALPDTRVQVVGIDTNKHARASYQ